MSAYTEDDAVRSAAERAHRDQGDSFTVYKDEAGTLYVRASRAAPPQGAKVVCIAQHWDATTVQVRYAGARSEWVKF